MFFVIDVSLEDKRGLSLGELIRPFCIMFTYCYLLCFMHNNAFWINSNAPVAGILDLEKLRQSYLFYTSPNELKIYENCFGIYKKYWSK